MTTSPIEMWEAEVNDLKRALGVANGERERLTREIVEAHKTAHTDGGHAALIGEISRLRTMGEAAKSWLMHLQTHPPPDAPFPIVAVVCEIVNGRNPPEE